MSERHSRPSFDEKAASETAIDDPDSTRLASRSGPADVDEDELVHYLVMDLGDGLEERREISVDPVIVGRGEDVGFRIDGTSISRRHCQLQVMGSQLTVVDLGSTNGTFIGRDRVSGMMVIPNGAKLVVGNQVLRHERRSRAEAARSMELEMDLRRASGYVQALLPEPISQGPVRTSWSFTPSALIGGDAFGYYDLDDDHFAVYLLDVCGHGAGPALHSVSVLNVVRNQSLSGVDFTRPEQVLAGLNRVFEMEQHNGLYFTMWYGVYRRSSRTLCYASAGHPPSLLVAGDRRDTLPLQTRNLAIGTFPGLDYKYAETAVPESAFLYVFSDGVFEIVSQDGREWTLKEFEALVLQPIIPGLNEADRLRRAVEQNAGGEGLEDDFSLLVVEFD